MRGGQRALREQRQLEHPEAGGDARGAGQEDGRDEGGAPLQRHSEKLQKVPAKKWEVAFRQKQGQGEEEGRRQQEEQQEEEQETVNRPVSLAKCICDIDLLLTYVRRHCF